MTELDPKFESEDDPDYTRVGFYIIIFLIGISILACILASVVFVYGSWELQLTCFIAFLAFTSYLWIRWKLRK